MVLARAWRRLDRLSRTWGSTPADRARSFPCDGLVDDPDLVAWRAVPVAAPAPVTFRWLCQMRVAPYSYDWIDNLGRRSPRRLTPGLEELAEGQRFMAIFRLEAFEPGSSLTLVMDRLAPASGAVAVTYRVEPLTDHAGRIVVKIVMRAPRGPWGVLWRAGAAPADLIMMRKQLLTFKALAEAQHRGRVESHPWQAPATSLLPRPR